MTVAELIEKLKTLPQELEVSIEDSEHGTYYPELDDVYAYPDVEPSAVNIG